MCIRSLARCLGDLLLPALAVGLAVGSLPALAAERRPNIVVIVGDDMGYADVGFHGCRDIPTPHLDKLAAGGIQCTQGYVSGPYCSPTRAGLMTGRYQQRFGHEFNPSGGEQGLATTEVTLANRLQAAGYVTGLMGKWHLGSQPQFHPQQRGFEQFYGFLGGAHDYFQKDGILRGKNPASGGGAPDPQKYLTDALGQESVAFIEQNKERPFFLYLAFNAVHTPMQADEARLAKFSSIENRTRRTYAAMMSALDDVVGQVQQKLSDTGLLNDTLVCFISDNGGPTMPGVTINGSRNDPLRGSKRTTLEGGIRVPFVVSWPGLLQAGKYDQPVIQLDLHATALAAAGIKLDPNWKLDGVNLLPHLQGQQQAPPHDVLLWRFGPQMAIRQGDYKLVRYDLNAEAGDTPPNAVDVKAPKVGVSPLRLYRLSDDIGEKNDLSASMPDKVAQLQARWDEWNATLVPPAWGGGAKAGGKAAGEKKAAAEAAGQKPAGKGKKRVPASADE